MHLQTSVFLTHTYNSMRIRANTCVALLGMILPALWMGPHLSSQEVHEIGNFIIFVLQLEKLRHREI